MGIDNENLVLGRLYPMFNIKSGLHNDTKKLRKVSHQELCYSIQYWLEQNRLLLVEPINVLVTQSLRDEGVDLILECLSSKIHIGFQLKSFGDIKNRDFASNLKKQIATSKKHGINKLFICFGGDLTYRNHEEKINGMISEINEINKTDEYMYVISPLKMLQIYEAYNQKKHPLRYALNMGTVRDALNAIIEALSDHPHYVPSIDFSYKLRKDVDLEKRAHKLSLSLKDESFGDGLTLFDKLEESKITGDSFRIPGDIIHKFVLDEEEIAFDPEKGFIEIRPEFTTLDPCSLSVESKDGTRTSYFENVIIERRKITEGIIHLQTKKEQKIELNLSVDPKLKKTSLGIKFDYSKSDVVESLNFMKFNNQLLRDKTLVISNENFEIPGLVTIKMLEPFEPEWISLYEKLVFIQNTINNPIILDKMPNQELIHDIMTLYDLLTLGETDKLALNMSFSIQKKNLIPLIEIQKENEFIDDLKTEIKEFGMTLFDYDIIFGDAIYEIDKMQISKSLDELEQELSNLSDETEVSVSLIRNENSVRKLSIKNKKMQVSKVNNK